MNKNRYRLIFSKVRGFMMAVAEHISAKNTSSSSSATSTNMLAPFISTFATVQSIKFALMLALGSAVIISSAAHADGIIADSSAPGNQQPMISNTANGVPFVNIQTPSAAGVSRNVYSQFDVANQGAVLNNSNANVQTQLGGWVQGNPYLAGGTARVILNEVNSSNPSLLNGYIEIAGSRAQIVIANPAGISCDGCGFINANRATLTTGTPMINSGNLIGYRVGGGSVSFLGAGLDASQANFTDVIARSVAVNAGIWANALSITTGTNQVNIDSSGNQTLVTPITPTGTAPSFAVDVAALGGMYAGKIHLIGTEAGLGVTNASTIGASVGEVTITVDGQLINSGSIGGLTQTAINATDIINQSSIISGGDIALTAQNIDNQAGAEIGGANTSVDLSGTITNRGLIDGSDTFIHADAINNIGTGAVFGDHLALTATTITNESEIVSGVTKAAVFAARNQLDIGVDTISNEGGALIFSSGDIAIGGTLDTNHLATGQATSLLNDGATIEALGGVAIAASDIQNLNAGIETTTISGGTVAYDTFRPNNASVTLDTADYPGAHIGNFNIEYRSAAGYTFREYWRWVYSGTTTLTDLVSSLPGQILSGSDMQLSGAVINNDSEIIAGRALNIIGPTLQNLNTSGTSITTYGGRVYYYDYDGNESCSDAGDGCYDISNNAYNPAPTILTFNLSTTKLEQNTTPSGSATTPQTLTVADSSLFATNLNPAATYLVETNPQFASYRTWLSSDYMMSQLSFDPAMTQKRLGDGFYEQKLVREQVAQLTGRRFLDGYASDEAQYQALMTSGITLASSLQLIPGIALTAEQVAQLTSDIVWLVEQEVTLADGTTTKALVPQVYVKLQDGDLDVNTGIMAGNTVNIQTAGDINNQGTIAGRTYLALNSENLQNLGGILHADNVIVQTTNDINNIGGTISAKDMIYLDAGNNINVESTTQSSKNKEGLSNFSRTNLDRVAGLYVSNPSAALVVNAGNDVNLNAASIANAGADGITQINAVQNINLGTVGISEQNNSVWNAKNYAKDGSTQEIGTVISTKADIEFNAGSDFNARAASITSDAGSLDVNAGKDIKVKAGRETSSLDTARKVKKSGFLSGSTKTYLDSSNADNTISSNLSADTINLQAGSASNVGNIAIQGSNVVSTNGTLIQATGDVAITSAVNTTTESHTKTEKKTGFSASGASIGYGTTNLSQSRNGTTITNTGSTVGSTDGDVNIQAGNAYSQIGSDVLTPQGDINIDAKKVDIIAANNTSTQKTATEYKQSGLTLAITSPVINAIQTIDQMKQASSQTSDGRMQALAAGTSALAAKNGYDATMNALSAAPSGGVADAANQVGGVNLSLSIGTSKSSSSTTETSNTMQSSHITAGGDINIKATGAGQDSDINVIGSELSAGNNLTLKADNKINLVAAQNTDTLKSKNSSSSASLGISIGSNGLAISAGLSASKGKADGTDIAWTETTVEAGNKVTLESGTDTNLIGAQVKGNQVVANVGKSGQGNLNIQSLQDTSTYDSKQKSMSVSVSIPIGAGMAGGSISSSSSKISSDYASVNEQAGIFAGDEGFQVNVNGNTNLTGAVIASNLTAIDQNNNSLITKTITISDIKNKAEYDAKAASATVGGGIQAGLPQLSGAGLGSDSDKASSTTVSAISQGAVSVTESEAQESLTGKDADMTVALLNRDVHVDENGNTVDSQGNSTAHTIAPIFDADKVAKEIQAQVEITEAFNQQASQAVGTYVQNKRQDLHNKLKNATADEKVALQMQLSELRIEEQVMNVLIGAVTGMGSTALTKESLSVAADQMRQLMIKDSEKFAGVIDVNGNTLDNIAAESEGVRLDGKKVGGTRVDLDLLCGVDNSSCAIQMGVDGKPSLDTNGKTQLALKDGQVEFLGDLKEFIKTPQGKEMVGPTGGIQGIKGTLFGKPYEAGSWQDKLIESFSGTHDFIGGSLSGLYDENGNIKRGMTDVERSIYNNLITTTAIPIATPFAVSELLPPAVWQAISIFINGAK